MWFHVKVSELFLPVLGVLLFLLILVALCEVFLGGLELLSDLGLDVVLGFQAGVVLFGVFKGVAYELYPQRLDLYFFYFLKC